MANRTLVYWFIVISAVAAPALAQNPSAAAIQDAYFTSSDGTKIHYFTVGSSGSPVVLIHGFMDSAERMWINSGIAKSLAAHHRVVAIDNRNHGKSDAPEPGQPGRPQDVIEVMDYLKIGRAHIHGYSMGGTMVVRLLASNPERFLSAGLGGSGIFEMDERFSARADSLDKPVTTPPGVPLEAAARLRAFGEAQMQDASRGIKLATVAVPVLAINGEFDRPFFKTQRMWRELRDFHNVVLLGKNHMTALGFGVANPEYVKILLSFLSGTER